MKLVRNRRTVTNGNPLHNVGDVYNFWYHFDDGYLAVMPAQTSPTAYHYIPSYHYQVRDYQGNIRVVVDEVGNLEQKNEYFAYGGPWAHKISTIKQILPR